MRLLQAILGLSLLLWAGACSPTSPPFGQVLVDAVGNEIRVKAIDDILNDGSLDADQKREQLRSLGITDEQVLELLVSSNSPAL